MTAFDPQALREYSKKELLRVLDSVRGKKSLVIDDSLTGLLSLVTEYTILKVGQGSCRITAWRKYISYHPRPLKFQLGQRCYAWPVPQSLM
jgi:hypothetical protein